jgi:hypothetical protein
MAVLAAYGQSNTKGPNQATLIVTFWSVVQFNHTRCVVEVRTLRTRLNTVMLIGIVIIAQHLCES